MAIDVNGLKQLCFAAVKAEKNAPVAYSYNSETFSASELNEAIRDQFGELTKDYYTYKENQNLIFRIISESIDEVLPVKVMKTFEQFAEVKQIPQGDKAIFKTRVTEASKKRAKGFVTRVGLAGRYETFKLDGSQFEVKTGAIGAAARIEFEEFLDGRWNFADFVDVILEGMEEYIYVEIMNALASVIANLPSVNKKTGSAFSESNIDNLLGIADSYGKATIFCTYEWAATMKPASADWASPEMKNDLWNKGWLDNYKGHNVVILPQSYTDATNITKVIDPQWAYIIPTGVEKPVKIVLEGATQVREIEDNDDWSRDMQTYKKVGVAIREQAYWICAMQNTGIPKTNSAE